MKDEKLSLSLAAKALNVTSRTIQRYASDGLLTKIQEGHRTFYLADEIRKLRRKKTDRDHEIPRNGDNKDVVTISSDRFYRILTELGEMKAKNENLLSYRFTNEKLTAANEKLLLDLDSLRTQVDETNQFFKEILISDQQKTTEIKELKRNLESFQKELERVKKRSFIKRIFNK